MRVLFSWWKRIDGKIEYSNAELAPEMQKAYIADECERVRQENEIEDILCGLRHRQARKVQELRESLLN